MPSPNVGQIVILRQCLRLKELPPGLKPNFIFIAVSARVKSCLVTKLVRFEFFASCRVVPCYKAIQIETLPDPSTGSTNLGVVNAFKNGNHRCVGSSCSISTAHPLADCAGLLRHSRAGAQSAPGSAAYSR